MLSLCLRLKRLRHHLHLRCFAALCAITVVAAAALSLNAHEGHDHGAPAVDMPASASPRGEAVSDNFELVAVANGTELLIYLDRFDTNAPVTDAMIDVETPDGPKPAVTQDGLYRLAAPWLKQHEKGDLIFTVTAGALTDILPLSLDLTRAAAAAPPPSVSERLRHALQPGVLMAGLMGFLLGAGLMHIRRRRVVAAGLVVAGLALLPIAASAHEGHDHAEVAPPAGPTGERAQRLPDGTTFVPKPVQRIFGVRTIRTASETHRRMVELPGRIIPDPNASGFVQAAVGGRLSPPQSGFPRLGTPVQQGEVLAYVTPPLQAIDASDMRQRQGELDQQIDIVGRRVARFEKLAPSGTVSQVQLEEARAELQGLKDRRAALDTARQVPEALIAPVSGVIAEGTPIAGQMAQPNAVIFHIVDPAKLWVEALSVDVLAGAETASAVTATGKRLALAYRGAGFADRSQSIPLHFSVEDGARGLRAGQLVTVLVNTSEEKQGLAIPRASIVRNTNGQDFVYEHISPERFAARAVRVEALDGDRVLIVAGIEPGTRIVTQGAELIDHVR
jgi:membrane fusion protein, heavy metal efflux system